MKKINLGNSIKWDIEPDIITNCRNSQHQKEGHFHTRGVKNSHNKHIAWCDKCNFIFHFSCNSCK